MTDFPEIALDTLDVEMGGVWEHRDEFVLVGSIVLWLHGLRESVGDIDVFAKREFYDRLKTQGWTEVFPNPKHPPMLEEQLGGLVTNVWYEWAHPHHLTVEQVFEAREWKHGWPVMPLSMLRQWKATLGRDKDLIDVAAIDARTT